MKAIVINEYGDKGRLREIEFPKAIPKAKEVQIELYATSINPIDWKVREGYLQGRLPFKFPIILGWDAAGVVSKVGTKVEKFEVGDRVFARPATTERGTYAQYVTADESLVAKMPKETAFIKAAAVPLAGLTAWQCLVDFAHIEEGDRVLIHAGAGGVGSMAIQIAKHFGAQVIATGGSNSAEIAQQLGVDQFINYQSSDFDEELEDVDIVLDTIGGKVQERSFRVLRKGGVLVSIVQPPDEGKARKHDVKAGFVWLEPNGEQLEKLAELMANGELKPQIAKVFDFGQDGLREAHELSETGHVKGKIVIKIKEDEEHKESKENEEESS
ncbi:NADPH:quinone reductase-like Zn-dependent oxidoreductase [Scopulibacillus darangshiensis]|uniref:NADPH:quinone reductase-like Zn-dependent oxidoreductase n=1 Tax=Scopulibacillus darangshiensis TaxID=442528 RepID=A0A4R2NI12_9BACL|nr:NADP-dependent oxidoreductase [Scopulibacillus darangshiensis]TCP20970.1 NADPH:quinone reductase-like Zn-dependent oxidoreductase [Scopulibacillus darangshiensis]